MSFFLLEFFSKCPKKSCTRSKSPYKTVKMEYLINTLVSLIGTVGGTLGMFIGFSFIGTSDWLWSNIKSIITKSRLRPRQSVSEPLSVTSTLQTFGIMYQTKRSTFKRTFYFNTSNSETTNNASTVIHFLQIEDLKHS